MDQVSLKPALKEDCEFFFEVRNHPHNRSLSGNNLPISYENHVTWFSAKLANSAHKYFVICHNSDRAGYLRLDMNQEGFFEISIALLPEFQGKKIGPRALREAGRFKPLQALVKEENEASRRAFLRAGFTELAEKKENFLVFKYL